MLLEVVQRLWRSRTFWGAVGAGAASYFAVQYEAVCSASVVGGFLGGF